MWEIDVQNWQHEKLEFSWVAKSHSSSSSRMTSGPIKFAMITHSCHEHQLHLHPFLFGLPWEP